MKRLFTPWRMKYLNSNKVDEGCVFCSALEAQDDRSNLIIYRGGKSFVILNRYPYTTGHLMVIPYQHKEVLSDLDPETRAEMMELVNKASQVIKAVYKPAGFNIGINMGSAAGAGIAAHIHIHVVPRWLGDTNFIPVTGDTRLIPEELDVTFKRIKEAW
jgi:ATP adenylyltransferase